MPTASTSAAVQVRQGEYTDGGDGRRRAQSTNLHRTSSDWDGDVDGDGGGHEIAHLELSGLLADQEESIPYSRNVMASLLRARVRRDEAAGQKWLSDVAPRTLWPWNGAWTVLAPWMATRTALGG